MFRERYSRLHAGGVFVFLGRARRRRQVARDQRQRGSGRRRLIRNRANRACRFILADQRRRRRGGRGRRGGFRGRLVHQIQQRHFLTLWRRRITLGRFALGRFALGRFAPIIRWKVFLFVHTTPTFNKKRLLLAVLAFNQHDPTAALHNLFFLV